jgi:hypothetical protein
MPRFANRQGIAQNVAGIFSPQRPLLKIEGHGYRQK